MSLCYDFQKWTIISLAAVAISLTIGLLLQYAHGQENKVLGSDITIHLNGTAIPIPNGCVDYSDNFLDHHAEVTIKKSWTCGGDTVECMWRSFADYFLNRNYKV